MVWLLNKIAASPGRVTPCHSLPPTALQGPPRRAVREKAREAWLIPEVRSVGALHGREKQRSASDCANPGVAKQAGRNVGAPPARRNPGEGFIMIRIGKSPKAVRPGAS